MNISPPESHDKHFSISGHNHESESALFRIRHHCDLICMGIRTGSVQQDGSTIVCWFRLANFKYNVLNRNQDSTIYISLF